MERLGAAGAGCGAEWSGTRCYALRSRQIFSFNHSLTSIRSQTLRTIRTCGHREFVAQFCQEVKLHIPFFLVGHEADSNLVRRNHSGTGSTTNLLAGLSRYVHDPNLSGCFVCTHALLGGAFVADNSSVNRLVKQALPEVPRSARGAEALSK